MLRYWTLLNFLIVGLSVPLWSETVVDVSKEWKSHQSTMTAAEFEKKLEVTASTPTAVETCRCDPMTVQERLDDVTYAFTGMVIESPKPKKGKRTVVFAVNEIFKGDPKDEMKVGADMANDGCDLPFEEGQNYLIYSKWSWGYVYTHQCMGTKLLAKAKNELGPSQEFKEKLYIHLRNACMGRLDTACCLDSLKAMKVGYYVPEPDDGCPSGMVPDRLQCGGSYTWCVSVLDKTHEKNDTP